VSLALFSAADDDCIALATELLDFGASVDARLGARPLSHAARFGHVEMVDLLLARGAPIDASLPAGRSRRSGRTSKPSQRTRRIQ
jgi:ankyrin repeat protein